EPVVVLEESADHPEWVRIAAPRQPSDKDDRGYPGWVLRAHLGAPPAVSTHEAVIAVETAALRVGPDGQRVVTDVTYGTVLPILDDLGPESALRVGLPDGHSAWLDRSACVVRPAFGDGPGKLVADGPALVSAARRFVGLEYLWAGMSAYGLDCSGLVHLTFRALGLVVPRDAHDQATAGKRLPRSEARAGDLLFFARPGKGIHHVGFALDDPARVLHAPGTGSTVVDEPMNDDRRGTLLDYVVRFAS
ncbi:MAG TPA: C40 family peptidase, partial [Actinopolymorphaceae bacterium]